MISVVIPALNESHGIVDTLLPLQPMRQRGVEVVLVDGGSADETVALAAPYVDQLLHSSRGRARQMNCGAASARGTQLWFLHADTRAPENADQLIERGLQQALWGRFDVSLSGAQRDPRLRIVGWMMNRRSCWSGVATGDQGLFLQRALFEQLAGFPEIPLMEDIALSKRLRKVSRACCISTPLTTSSRRWELRGVLRTVILMWWLRFAYWVGLSPQRLARWYR